MMDKNAMRARIKARNRNYLRGVPLNHGLKWTEAERVRLVRLANLCRGAYRMTADAAITFIAPRHKRSRLAIYCQLFTLGLVEGPYNE